jgi:hypothetical protein
VSVSQRLLENEAAAKATEATDSTLCRCVDDGGDCDWCHAYYNALAELEREAFTPEPDEGADG